MQAPCVPRRYERTAGCAAVVVRPYNVSAKSCAWVWVLLLASMASPAAAQDQDIDAWPAVDIWLKLDPATRLYFMGTASWEKLGGTRERSFGTAIDRKLSPHWSFRVGVREVVSSSEFRDSREHRAILDLNYSRELSPSWKFVNRNRIDMRWVEGNAYSTRIRERVMFEKTSRIFEKVTWYGSGEVYYDDRYDRLSRTRVIFGASWRINKRVSLDAYGSRQWDFAPEHSQTTETGLVLGLYFDAMSTSNQDN